MSARAVCVRARAVCVRARAVSVYPVLSFGKFGFYTTSGRIRNSHCMQSRIYAYTYSVHMQSGAADF